MYGNANTINNNSSIWEGKTGTHGEWNETELEGELETLSGKLKSLWNRNKGRAQNLAKIGIDLMDILGTLANPLPPNDPSARTKRNQDDYAAVSAAIQQPDFRDDYLHVRYRGQNARILNQ